MDGAKRPTVQLMGVTQQLRRGKNARVVMSVNIVPRARPRAGAFAAVALAALASVALVAEPALAQEPPRYTVEPDILFARVDGIELRLDAYLPTTPTPTPGIIVIHGGGWSKGSRKDESFQAETLAKNGLAAFSVDYRLAPEHPFPAAVEDVLTAAAWVREHAARFNVDAAQLGALGGSAGGHLAGMLALAGSGALDQGPRIRAAVSWSGPLDLETTVRLARKGARAGIARFLGCDDVDDCPRKVREASPLSHLDATDAPIFIANSVEEFIPVQQARETAEGMDEQGVPYQLVEIPGDRHATSYARMTAPGLHGKTVFEASIAFLAQWVASQPQPQPQPSVTPTPEPPPATTQPSPPPPSPAGGGGGGANGNGTPVPPPTAGGQPSSGGGAKGSDRTGSGAGTGGDGGAWFYPGDDAEWWSSPSPAAKSGDGKKSFSVDSRKTQKRGDGKRSGGSTPANLDQPPETVAVAAREPAPRSFVPMLVGGAFVAGIVLTYLVSYWGAAVVRRDPYGPSPYDDR